VAEGQVRVATAQAPLLSKEAPDLTPECRKLLRHVLYPEGLSVKEAGQDQAFVAGVGKHAHQKEVPRLTDEREEVSCAPVLFRSIWALSADDVHRADGSLQAQQAAAEGLCC
jgi:hypothetical protein